MTTQHTLEYYAEPGPLTTAGPSATALAALPSTVPDLLAAVQGLLAHEPGSAQSATGHLRTTHQILDRILAAESRPLIEPRPRTQRLAGCCRHFTLVTVAALRAHGIPGPRPLRLRPVLHPGLARRPLGGRIPRHRRRKSRPI